MTHTDPDSRAREPFRLREIIVGIMLIILSVYSIVLGIRLDRQRDCLQSYIQTSSDTSTIRSAQVEAESQATRKVITGVFSGKIKTPEQFAALGLQYTAALASVDKARAENPVVPFDPDRCQEGERK